MVILRSQNKITDFLMMLAWASPFNKKSIKYGQILYYTAVQNQAAVTAEEVTAVFPIFAMVVKN